MYIIIHEQEASRWPNKNITWQLKRVIIVSETSGFCLLLFPQMRELSFSQFSNFLRKECWFFNFWMIKFPIMSKNIIVNFITQKLKNNHTSLKKYTKSCKTEQNLVLSSREFSFAQFCNFLRKLCLFFNFWMMNIQKVAKLSKTKFSRFEGTRGDKNQIFRTLVMLHSFHICKPCPFGSALRKFALDFFIAIHCGGLILYLKLEYKFQSNFSKCKIRPP